MMFFNQHNSPQSPSSTKSLPVKKEDCKRIPPKISLFIALANLAAKYFMHKIVKGSHQRYRVEITQLHYYKIYLW